MSIWKGTKINQVNQKVSVKGSPTDKECHYLSKSFLVLILHLSLLHLTLDPCRVELKGIRSASAPTTYHHHHLSLPRNVSHFSIFLCPRSFLFPVTHPITVCVQGSLPIVCKCHLQQPIMLCVCLRLGGLVKDSSEMSFWTFSSAKKKDGVLGLYKRKTMFWSVMCLRETNRRALAGSYFYNWN